MNIAETIQRLHKLRRMPSAEIGCRLARWRRQQRERRAYRSARRETVPNGNVPIDESAFKANISRLLPGVSQISQLGSRDPGRLSRLKTRAAERTAQILGGAYELLGHPLDLRGEIDWHCDPRSDFRWPRSFYADLPLYEFEENCSHAAPTTSTRTEGLSGGGRPATLHQSIDVKYVWELGRQQYVVELARAWPLTGDENAARRAVDLMLDFVRHNRLHEGIHWTSGLEVSIRAISWLWAIALLSDWPGWRSGELTRIAESLAEHATYLERHLSWYSSPYNHLIGEATGLYLIGTHLPECRSAEHWRALGREVLEQAGPEQFHADGFSVEQSTGYHFFTLGFLLMAIAVAHREGAAFHGLEPVVQRACRSGALLRQPDGLWPIIGDADSGQALPIAVDEPRDFSSICNLAAVLFDDRQLKIDNADENEPIFWMTGSAGLETWQQFGPTDAPTRRVVLPESGYAVAADESGSTADWLLFDAGPIAAGVHHDARPSAAHGHADMFQVLYDFQGSARLIDPGIPFYFGPRDWVDFFREPVAHNTLEVEGAPVVRTAGRLAWSHAGGTPDLAANLSDDAWLARARARAPWVGHSDVTIERHLLALPGVGLWIADWIDSRRPRRVDWYWQLSGGTIREATDSTAVPWESDDGSVVMAIWSASIPPQIDVEDSADDSPVGWQAESYGRLRPGRRMHVTSARQKQSLVCTYIGRPEMAFEVAVNNQRLVGGIGRLADPAEQVDRSAAVLPGAEIVWHIRAGAETSLYAAGIGTAPTGSGWRSLEGTGGWPAVAMRATHSPVG